jgi:Fe-S cluster biogenesis protein NfuA
MTNDTATMDEVKVRPQATPNPHAIKFIVNQTLKQTGKVSYRSLDEVQEGMPIVASIFNLNNISQIFIFQNTMTVTHNGEWDNEELKGFVAPIIKTQFKDFDTNFKTPEEIKEEQKKEKRKEQSPDIQSLEAILDRTIRPGLRADGGDIEINDYDHPELYVTFQGACGNCPSSTMGTLQAIQGILSTEFKDDIQVIPE